VVSLGLMGLLALLSQPAPAQARCDLGLAGRVVDAAGGEGVPNAELIAGDGAATATSAPDGRWVLSGLCAGPISLLVSAPAFRAEAVAVVLPRAEPLEVRLTYEVEPMMVVSAPRLHMDAVLSSSLDGEALASTRGGSLGEALEGLAGARVLRSGTVAKPVIDGFVGNRVLILNDGIRHYSQLWGHDHAPELDPFAAARLRVVRGAAAVRYGADALGGAVLVEPPRPRVEAGVEGELNLVGQSNGRQGTANVLLNAALPADPRFTARVQGSFRRAAGLTTPDYALDNTGQREGNVSGALGFHGERLELSLSLSRYSQQFGVFTGQVSDGAAQFFAAIDADRPRNVDLYRSDYDIERPYQDVVHTSGRAEALYKLSAGTLRLLYGLQHNDRREFDLVRRALTGPQLEFALLSQSVELTFERKRRGDHEGIVGVTGLHQFNDHSGRRFIPDYTLFGGGVFAIERFRTPSLALEVGARYERQQADTEQPARIAPAKNPPERDRLRFDALMASLGLEASLGQGVLFEARAASATRLPTMNELFIDGISQGQGTFEVGDRGLAPEQALSLSAAVARTGSTLDVQLHAFVQAIHDYIYFAPLRDASGAPTTRSTIYGTFPTFAYRNVDALQAGGTAELTLRPLRGLELRSRGSWVRARNVSDDTYLLFIPADRYENRLTYRAEALGPTERFVAWVESAVTTRQTRVDLDADFAPPPAAYHLLNAGVGATLQMAGQPLELSVEVRNALDVRYRDYLSRLRYFADEPGFNAILRVRIPLGGDVEREPGPN
jgi:iron complex outermembrane receptor protein